MASTLRWTTADLEALPEDNGKRYEIIDGELFVSTTPHWNHQQTCVAIVSQLERWCRESGAGKTNLGPGLIFAEDNVVAPDIVWVSRSAFPPRWGRTANFTRRQNSSSKCYHRAARMKDEIEKPNSSFIHVVESMSIG